MPVSIKTGVLKYKNPVTGEFISLNQVGDDLYSIIAPKYEDVTFPVNRGTLCIYDGGLYRATVDIPLSEEWDNTHWASTSVDDEMSDYATRIIDDNSDGLNKTWSANKISSALEDINSFDVQIVQELPTQNIKTHTIYFVPKTGSTNDAYEEYIRVNNAWELIGTTEIDLSSKADKTELHVTPVFSSGSNLGEYVCNLTFQEVYDAASNGKCDGCIVQVAPGMGIGLELMAVLPSMVSFAKTDSMEGGISTIALDYHSDGSISREKTELDILRLFAKTYAFNTGIFPIKAGDYCIHNNKYYKANTDISAYEAFNSSKWDEVSVGNELKSILVNSNAMVANIEADNTSDHDYAIGDIFVYSNKLYKATSAIAENNIIVPDQNCVETTISSALSDKEDKPFIVTFDLTYDGQTHTFAITSDKTLSEIGEAYNNGKQIKSYVIDHAVPGGMPVTPTNELTNVAVLSVGGFILVQFIGTVYLQATPTSVPMGVQISGMGSPNDSDEWNIKLFDYLISEYSSSGSYSALGRKIENLGAPTDAEDATTKGYVDTALATKEDKPDLIVTYTIAGNNTATCDKTIEEIGQAYGSGKNIEAIIIGGGQRFKAQIFTLKQRDASYLFFVSTTIIFESVTYIVLLHYSGSETIPVMQTQPMLSMDGAYIAQNMKIAQLANPTDATDAANKGYVDTALATKEDKAFDVTFNLAYDTLEVTSDKTVAEIGAAYDAGKKINAVVTRPNGQFPETTKLTGSTLVSADGQYTFAFSGRIRLDVNEPYSDIVIVGASSIPTWQLMIPIGKINDVQINGTSIISNHVANIPVADSSTLGVVAVNSGAYGISLNSTNKDIRISQASSSQIKAGTQQYAPIAPYRQHESAFYGLAKAAGDNTQALSSNAVGTYTDEAKAAIQSMLGVEPGVTFVETVDGATPSITGEPNVRYVCGTVTELSITPPSSGTIEVIFVSGTTPTVLTIPNTVKFPDWVDLSELETSTKYDIIITDGTMGAVMTWAE